MTTVKLTTTTTTTTTAATATYNDNRIPAGVLIHDWGDKQGLLAIQKSVSTWGAGAAMLDTA
jgi:hypothetical protein